MKITAKDFYYLPSTSMEWTSNPWGEKIKRFELEEAGEIGLFWKWGHWFDTRASLILAKAFLDQELQIYQSGYDTGADEWFILTNWGRGINEF